MNKQLVGFGLATLGVLLFSTKAVMVKLGYQYDVDAITMLFLRMLIAFPIYLTITLVDLQRNKGSRPKLTGRQLVWLIFLGALGYYVASFFDFLGLTYVSASLERLILFTYPTFVVLLAWIFLKQRIQSYQLIAILITYFGMLVMFSGSLFGGGLAVHWGGVFLIVMSALTYAGYLVGSQELIKQVGTARFTGIAMIVACLSVMLHFVLTSDVDLTTIPSRVYLLGFLMAVFATVIPSYLISMAIQRIGASNMSIIGALGPVSTIVLAMIFLNERLTTEQVIGAVIIVSAIVWMNLRRKT